MVAVKGIRPTPSVEGSGGFFEVEKMGLFSCYVEKLESSIVPSLCTACI
jgi:hypothetical protein